MHVPVLFNETLEYLITDPRGVYVDCTVGGGGHLQGIIARTGEEAVLIGIDQDGEILEKTRTRMSGHANVILAKGNFRNLQVLHGLSITSADDIDIQVSSFSTDEKSGFSYHLDDRLMRMDRIDTSAWDLVNKWPWTSWNR